MHWLLLNSISLPTMLMALSTAAFFVLERGFPGRRLPHAKGWYTRCILINLTQLSITLATARLWAKLFPDVSLLKLADWDAPFWEGLVGWIVGTFFFYWWHRVRHAKGWWLIFHQVHHSPSRIELLTSFYKHPVEIFADAVLSAAVLYPLLGCSLLGAFWYNFFAGTGEYFYHANVKTPRWLRYVIQTLELHSIHHQFNVHGHNFGDIPLWDRLFGTYKDAIEFVDRCGFPARAEERLVDMLCFRDVYVETRTTSSDPAEHAL